MLTRLAALALAFGVVAPSFARSDGDPSRAAEGKASPAAEIKVLIIDGQNNHNWKAMTPFMKAQIEKAGMFKVDVSTTPPGKGKNETPEQAAERQKAWDAWRPSFKDYAVVLSNYNGEKWPEPVNKAFEEYVSNGGGVLAIHAANNAFTGWKEYEKMVGLCWRDAKYAARVYYDDAGKLVREEAGTGKGAGHGKTHEFKVLLRDPEHPIVKGMPKEWMHATDELYHGQRGPAENMHVIASAYDDKAQGGTGVHEMMLWVIPYGKGKVVTNVMGHVMGAGDKLPALQCVGFITITNRTLEWLATGKVTIAIPDNFPTAEKSSLVAK
jgi:type 1 glutamine amidotransferase